MNIGTPFLLSSFTHSNLLIALFEQVRVTASLCLGDLVHTLDKGSVQDVLQTIQQCTAVDRSAPTLLCTLGVSNSVLKKVRMDSFFFFCLFLIFSGIPSDLQLIICLFRSSSSVWSRVHCRACPPFTHTSSRCPTVECSAVYQIYALCQRCSQVVGYCCAC